MNTVTHGTRTAYQRGCRCGSCREANAVYAYTGNRRARLSQQQFSTRLEVACWCEETTVWLPVEMVRACVTVSCGRRDCVEAA